MILTEKKIDYTGAYTYHLQSVFHQYIDENENLSLLWKLQYKSPFN